MNEIEKFLVYMFVALFVFVAMLYDPVFADRFLKYRYWH